MYDENMRYVSSTLTPGWNRLKPGLRYVVLTAGKPPIVYEQGDIGFHLEVHNPWIPKENIRYSYSWIKGAVGPRRNSRSPSSCQPCSTTWSRREKDQPLGVDFIDINLIKKFEERGISWTDGMTPMMEAGRSRAPTRSRRSRSWERSATTSTTRSPTSSSPGSPRTRWRPSASRSCTPCPGWRTSRMSSSPRAQRLAQLEELLRPDDPPGELVIVDLACPHLERLQVVRLSHLLRRGQADRRASEDLRPGPQVALGLHRGDEAGGHHRRRGLEVAVRQGGVGLGGGPGGANFWGHGLGLAQYDPPVISRIWSLDHPVEIQPGMTSPSRPNTGNSTITVCVSKKCST